MRGNGFFTANTAAADAVGVAVFDSAAAVFALLFA